MTKLSQQQEAQLTALLQHLLPGQNTAEWRDSTLLLGAIPEFDSMALANLLAGIESQFNLELDDSLLTPERFTSLGSVKEFLADLLNR